MYSPNKHNQFYIIHIMPTKSHKTIQGRCYALRSTGNATVTAMREDTTYTLASHSGQEAEVYFTAIGAEVSITASDPYVLQELFNAAPLASAGAGGGTSIEYTGIMPVEYLYSDNRLLKGGVMYKIDALTDLDMSPYSLPTEAAKCVTCELIVDTTYTNTESLDPAMILWPESWEWVSGIGTTGSAPPLEGGKHYYFAIRTVMGKTVINHYLTTDQA